MTHICRPWRLTLALGLCLLLFACGPVGLLPPPDREDAADALFRQAESRYRSARYTEAGSLYDRYLQLYPQGKDAGRARLRTAEVLGIKGDWVQARSRYEQIAAQSPDPSLKLRAQAGLGQANFKLGNYPAATQILEGLQSARLPADLRFKTSALLTEIALKTRNFSQAFIHLNQAAMNLEAGEEEWFRDLKVRLLDGAGPAELKKLVETNPAAPLSAAVLFKLAQTDFAAGRPEPGQAWLQQLYERFPDSPEAAQARQLFPVDKRESIAAAEPEVGCLLPLTGSYAKVGQQVRQGMELAAEGSRLKLVIKDSQGDSAAAARLVEELAAEEGVKALLGPVASVSAVGAAQAAQSRGLPIITLTQRKDVTGLGNLVFRDFLTGPQQVKALVDYAVSRRGLKRFAILYPQSTYGQTFAKLFQEEANRAGGLIVTQVSYPDASQDFSAAVATLAQANRPGPEVPGAFDALFIPDEAATAATLADHLAAANLTGVSLLGTNLWNAPDVLTVGSLQGALFPEAFFPGDPDPEVQAFAQAYRRRYGQEPTYMAAQGYSAVKVMTVVLAGRPDLSRAEVAARLLETRQIPGFSLFLGFAANREAELKIKILTIKDQTLQVAD